MNRYFFLYYCLIHGILLIIIGIILLIKRVEMFPTYVDKFVTVPTITALFIEYYIIENKFNPLLMIVYIILLIFVIYTIQKQKGEYFIINIDTNQFESLYIEYLKELNLYINKTQVGIKIKNNEDKLIKIKKFRFNVVSFDIRDYRKDDIYNDLINITKEIKRIVKKKYLSWYPVIPLILGINMVIIYSVFLDRY